MFKPDHLKDAIALCEKVGLEYRYEQTAKGHLLFYIGSQSVICMNNHKRNRDQQIYYSVIRDVKRAIKKEMG